LFDTFEVNNGARNKLHNNTLFNSLKNISPDYIEDLYRKYKIELFIRGLKDLQAVLMTMGAF